MTARATAAVTALVASLLGVLALAGPASAHVRVSSDDATPGGYGVLAFRVPTESATASTTRLQVTFPSDHPISSVSTRPLPGWTAKVLTKKLSTPVRTDDGEVDTYVAEVDWTAQRPGDAIRPGQFQQFEVSVGPLPDVDSLSFPTTQHYSDGTTVRWNESSTAGAEPEHPAPTLTLRGAADRATGSGTTMHMDADGASSWLGIAGLVAGVLGLLLGALALARSDRKSDPPA